MKIAQQQKLEKAMKLLLELQARMVTRNNGRSTAWSKELEKAIAHIMDATAPRSF